MKLSKVTINQCRALAPPNTIQNLPVECWPMLATIVARKIEAGTDTHADLYMLRIMNIYPSH